MAVDQADSQAEQINKLFETLLGKLNGVPIDLQSAIENDVAALRSSIGELVQNRGQEEKAARMKYLRAAILESEARYRELGDNLSDPLAVFGRDLRLIYRNKAAQQISTITNEKAMGKTFEELYPRFVGTNLHKAYLRAINTQQMQSHLNHWVHPENGEACYYEITFYPGRDWIVVISENVTDREQALNALRKSEAFNSHLIESSSDSIKLLDPHGRLISMNSGAVRLLGAKDAGALVGKDWLTLWDEAYRPAVQAAMEAAQKGMAGSFQAPRKSLQGKELWWDVVISPIRGAGNTVEQLLVISRDITEQKRTEDELRRTSESLRESEGRFRAMADGTPVIIWVTDSAGRMEFINKAYTGFFGVALEQVKSNTWQMLVHPEDTERYVNVYMACLREQKPFRARGRVLRHDGAWRWMDSHGQPRFSDTGEFLGMAGSSIDITEQVQAEAALRKSEEKFATAFHASPVAMAITRLADGVYLDVNDHTCRLLGYTREEILNKTSLELHIYQDVAEREDFLRQLQKQGRLRNFERTVINRSGQPVTVTLSFEQIEVDGECCVLAAMMDITEQKRSEAEREALMEELRVQKDLLERLIQNLPIGVAVLNGPEHRFALVNSAQRALFPTVEEFVGRTVLEVWPDIQDTFKPVLDRVFQTGEPFYASDASWTTDKGNGPEETFYSFSYTPLNSADGSIEGILVLSQETTEQVRIHQRLEEELEERKEAEVALAQAHRELVSERNRLMAVMEALPVGLAILNEKGGIEVSNPGYEAVWGGPRPNAESVDDYDNYQAWWVDTGTRLEPHEWAAAQILRNGQPVTGQYLKIRRFDNGTRYVMNSAAPVRDDRGNLIGGAVAILDITEQKQLEFERQEVQMQMEVQRRLMDQREKERQSIARDIHDGPIQTLASTAFNIQIIKEAFPDPALAVELSQIAMNVKSATRELREVVNDLRPPSILRFGLARAIMMHAEDLRERYPDVMIELALAENVTQIQDQSCLTLFRVFQEGMNNIYRHAAATRVWVRYEVTAEAFVLEIRDDGSGFEVPKDYTGLTGSGHYGLAGMNERVASVGATLTINSRPGTGTTITVRGPLVGSSVK